MKSHVLHRVWLTPKAKWVIALGAGVAALLVAASSVDANTRPVSPCPGVLYAPPPPSAAPAPPVKCTPGLLGIGNYGTPVSQVPEGPGPGPRPVGAGIPDLRVASAIAGMRSGALNSLLSNSNLIHPKVTEDNNTCANGYSYGFLQDFPSPDPDYIGNESTAVSDVAVTDQEDDEHSAVGLLSWDQFEGTGGDEGHTWLQMGFIRGNLGDWTDTLDSDQVEIYLEFQTDDVYEFDPLFAETQGEGDRYQFDITRDGAYYDFYLDDVLKWADVYQNPEFPPDAVTVGNEDFNQDGECDPGFADMNYFTPALGAYEQTDSGHAFQTSGDGPWQSGEATLEDEIPEGYSCGSNSGDVYWWCG